MLVIWPPGPPPRKIAASGQGIAGLLAAWLLAQRRRASVSEAEAHFGGRSHTVGLETSAEQLPADFGFIVYNEANYPKLAARLRHLEVPTAIHWEALRLRVLGASNLAQPA